MTKARELKLEELRLGGFVGLSWDLIKLGRKNCSPIRLQLMFPSLFGANNYTYIAIDNRGVEHKDVGRLVKVYDIQGRVVENPYAFETLVKQAVLAEVDLLVRKEWEILNYESFARSLRRE